MIDQSQYHPLHVASPGRVERVELGPGDGPLDVPAEAAGCKPGVDFNLSLAIFGRSDFCGHAEGESNDDHGSRRLGDYGGDDFGHRH